MKEYLNIGEIGSLFGLNVQTLHYYDRIGLFKPECRDNNSKYRKYKFDQVYQLASIRYLRKMGYSIENIQQFLNSRNPDRTIELLKIRSQALHDQWQEMMRIDEAIQRKIHFIEKKLATLDMSSVEIKWFPERQYIPIGSEEQLYMEDSFYFYTTIAFYEGNLKYFGAYIDTDVPMLNIDSTKGNSLITDTIPEGRYLVGYHKGAYESIGERSRQLQMMHSELCFGNLVANFNIIDQFVERNSENYITEIQIQIIDEV